MECPNCSESILDHAKICPFCQTRLDNKPINDKNNEININNKENLNNPFENDNFDISYTISSAEQSELIRGVVNKARSNGCKTKSNTFEKTVNRKKKKKISNKTRRFIFFATISIIFISLLAWGFSAIWGAVKNNESNTALIYLKNNSLFLSSNNISQEISNNLINIESYNSSQTVPDENSVAKSDAKTKDADKNEQNNTKTTSELTTDKIIEIFEEHNFVYKSKDERYIYFLSNFNVNTNLGTLKCYDTKKDKIIDVAENVSNSITVSKTGEGLMFLQNADFSGNSGILCYKNINKKGIINIAEDIDKNMYVFSQNSDKVIFLGNFNHSVEAGDLYEYDITNKKSEREKIDSDVCRIFGTDKSGEIYIYAKDYNASRGCYDIYKKELDGDRVKLIEETKIPPVISDINDEMYMYGGNEDENHNLYLVNVKNNESKKIASAISDIVKISEDESSVLYRKVFDNSTSDYYIYTKGNADSFKIANDIKIIPEDNKFSGISQFSISDDFTSFAYISGFDIEKGKGTLYKTHYNKKSIKESEKIADEAFFCKYSSDGSRIVYAKDYSVTRNVIDIYSYENSDSKLIKEEIAFNLFEISKNGDNIICIDGFNTVGEYGTLEIINKKGESKKVLEDVSAFYILEDDSIIMLKNYNNETHSFDIFKTDKKLNSVKLDENITYIVLN